MMEAPPSVLVWVLVVLLAVAGAPEVQRAEGAGECGRVPADRVAFRMAPCVDASRDANAPVSDRCCAEVRRLGQTPSCLCAVMLSNTAKSAGVRPEVAVTIPMRCNIADRPVGLKCGDYTLP
uniref:Putative non-specific lipid-transfer protein 2 n=1 Tax=Anthurium amnicola TaxID=1678845 RepID=A0A1D1YWI3_9ARAE